MDRETIVTTFWSKAAATAGVARTARNPINPPNEDDLPCINIFELEDSAADGRSSGGAIPRPVYKRELQIVAELFILSSSEPAVSKELWSFVDDFKRAIYSEGVTLGLRGVDMAETETSRVLRPPNLEKVAGVGIVFKIMYVESISSLFN